MANQRYSFDDMVQYAHPGDVFKLVNPDNGMYMVMVTDMDYNTVPLFIPGLECRAQEVELGSEISWKHYGRVFEYVRNLNGVFRLSEAGLGS